jgi:hypothetical protein
MTGKEKNACIFSPCLSSLLHQGGKAAATGIYFYGIYLDLLKKSLCILK